MQTRTFYTSTINYHTFTIQMSSTIPIQNHDTESSEYITRIIRCRGKDYRVNFHIKSRRDIGGGKSTVVWHETVTKNLALGQTLQEVYSGSILMVYYPSGLRVKEKEGKYTATADATVIKWLSSDINNEDINTSVNTSE